MTKRKIVRKLIWPHIGGLFLLLSIIGVSYLNLRMSLQAVNLIGAETEEMLLVVELSLALERVVMPVNDYLIVGAEEQEKEKANFVLLSQDVEQLFAKLGALEFDVEKEQFHFNSAREKFNQVKLLAQRIFALEQPYNNPEAGRLMEEMDALADSAIFELARFKEAALEEHKKAERKARVIVQRSRKFFIGGAIISLLGLFVLGIFLPLLIAGPITKLHEGAELIGKGNFSHRIHIQTHDELQQLA